MHRYVIGRLALAMPTLLGITVIIFTIMRVLPGDAADAALAETSASPAQVAAQRKALGLDDALPVQYFRWVSGLVRLDAGESLITHQPISDELSSRIPVTLELAIAAVVLATVIAIPSGMISAVFRNSWPDYVVRVLSIAGIALPIFWIQSLLRNFVLPKYIGWLPPPGYASLWIDPGTNFAQMWLPILTLAFAQSAIVSRLVRSTMLDVLREDYIRTARAKGLRGRTILRRHAARNALLPVITLSSIQLGALLGGAVVTESVFGLPGIGRYVLEGIRNRDYPVVQTVVVLIAGGYVFINLAVDILYGVVDPRVRVS